MPPHTCHPALLGARMRLDFLPFSRPSIAEDEIAAVVEVLRSGWITTGPRNAEFEQRFCEYVGSRGAVSLVSATAGMHLVLRALGIGPGDEVITPSMTWVSTINLIVLAGATPVFADVDRDTLMVTPDSIRRVVTERTRAIVPVHFAGAAAEMAPLRRLAAERGLHLVEDAAHAVGTEDQGERIGKRGTTVFSFHPIKNITSGEGGMVCSEDEDILERVRRLRFHGLGRDAYDRQLQGRAPQAEVLEPGFKYNLPDILAALGLHQLARIESFVQRRTVLAERYRDRLGEIDEIIPLAAPPPSTRHAWHLFVVRLDTDRVAWSRDEFMHELQRRNIGTGLHFRAAHLHRYYRENLPVSADALPNTTWNSDRILSLPLFPDMQPEDVDDVVTAIKEVLAS
jgi:UDP-4-amino-4-deoxy-L-arabinose-oxoglutarate aminotransferase